MKKTILFLICSGTILATAQNNVNINPVQYDILKQSGQLDLTRNYVLSGAVNNSGKIKPSEKALSNRTPSPICSCLINLDSTFAVVPFSGYAPPDYRNDDASSGLISLPFTFNLYGVNFNSLYINNNGNISFTSPYSTFTANPFPDASYNMIAPFWGDVDSRDSASGLVYYKITATSMIVKWENVGYYSSQSDKLNTFQLIITDGTDPILPAGENVSFCYGDMAWTTGSASGGVNGFGGTPATVGVNMGNGIDYFQVGTFDSTGIAFDGPYGASDEVDWLDNQGIYFNTAVTGNIPPIVINNVICDTIDVYTGDTIRTMLTDSVVFTLRVNAPEISQKADVVFTSSEPSHFSYFVSLNTLPYKEYTCMFDARNLAPGLYFVNISATDDGTPVKQTNKTIVIRNNFYSGTPLGIIAKQLPESITIYPNPAQDNITVKHGFNSKSNPMLSITDILGKEVMTLAVNSQAQAVDISLLVKGIYFASVKSSEGKSKTIKIVKK